MSDGKSPHRRRNKSLSFAQTFEVISGYGISSKESCKKLQFVPSLIERFFSMIRQIINKFFRFVPELCAQRSSFAAGHYFQSSSPLMTGFAGECSSWRYSDRHFGLLVSTGFLRYSVLTTQKVSHKDFCEKHLGLFHYLEGCSFLRL